MQLKIKNKPIVILSVLAMIFFFIYSFLIFGNQDKIFTWPDETANYFFISNFIEHSNFSVAEPLNEIAGNLIKPRSFNVYQGNLVPGSFLGMLLVYGLIGKIAGPNLILFLTPLLAVIAGLYFYKLMLKIFKPNIAFLSALFFFLNPAWWYYASFSMLPNISFISFLIIGFYYLVNLGDKSKKNIFSVCLGSFFIALALIIRTNEFIWVVPIIGFLFFIYYKKVKWYYALIFIAVNVLVFVPVFYYNNLTYGSAFSFGYLRLEQGSGLANQLPPEFKTSPQGSVFDLVKFLVLPFGFSAGSLIHNIKVYYVNLLWWLFVPALIGIFSLVKNYQKREKAVYLVLSLLISFFLIIYYGSWVFEDQMTLQLNKIGISYVRYFLPIYILSLPFAAIFYLSLFNLVKSKKWQIVLGVFVVLFNFYFTYNLLFISGYDNLVKIKATLNSYSQINKKITSLTEDNSVIISARSDKIFFPQRKVIGKWQDEEVVLWLDLLAQNIPLYYYAYEGADYIYNWNDSLGYDNGLVMLEKEKITDKETLYQIKMMEENYEE